MLIQSNVNQGSVYASLSFHVVKNYGNHLVVYICLFETLWIICFVRERKGWLKLIDHSEEFCFLVAANNNFRKTAIDIKRKVN